MTFAIGHVNGGTNAGRRRIRKPKTPWDCRCVTGGEADDVNRVMKPRYWVRQPASLTRCPVCGTRRPTP
jgi:hypothetical protein